MTEHPIYLGDGVYAELEGFQVELRTNRLEGKHWLTLEPDAIQTLVLFLRRKGWTIK